ncbi:glycoside hydrolase family 2 TIM barrel-domain containing protein [Candidatus Izemoplasma sp. B36]|uniref:golvesin C-terminal-like domain-containing protein n=1 Tax=Candidatus Izemoplasma sp. B36 TaxID=3242468 RepID=UPI003555C0A4
MKLKKILILTLFLLINAIIVSCQVTSTGVTSEFTTTTFTTTTNSTTQTSGTTVSTTIDNTSELSNSPSPEEDSRPSASFTDGRIIIDNGNKEFTYRNARIIDNDINITTYGDSYIDNGESSRFNGSFTPSIETAGYYKIYINYPELENASDEVYLQIDYNGGLLSDYSKVIDQTMNAGYWVLIGTYYLAEGINNAVHIFGDNNKTVAADAIMFELSVATDEITSDIELEFNDLRPTGSVVKVLKTRALESRLSVDGQAFFAKGICGVDELELMAEAGANTARTYSVEALEDGAILDQAYELGIKIVVGLWMDHESSSFTYYDNPSGVEEQYNQLIKAVDKYKNHPAILAWAVGNEVDISTSEHPLAIYDAINDIAKYIHENDPFHPTMAVLAGSSTTKIARIAKYAPHIDIIGINSYKHIGNVKTNIISWVGPYMVTEFAMNQPMDTTLKTTWSAIIEPSSQEKADLYYQRYNEFILGEKDNGCVGSYAFKDTGSFRVTHTWYGIIYEGKKTPQYYAMMAAWTETDRVTSLQIDQVTLNDRSQLESVYFNKGETVSIDILINQEDLSNVTISFEVKNEVSISTNNIPIARTDFNITSTENLSEFLMTINNISGNYRLFVYIENEEGQISTYSYVFAVN